MIRYAIFMSLILCTGCVQMFPGLEKPFGVDRGMVDGTPPGTELFRAGWKDGCPSGLSTSGSMMTKVMNGYYYDHNKGIRSKDYRDINNNFAKQEYYSGWTMGFNHCRWYNARWHKWK